MLRCDFLQTVARTAALLLTPAAARALPSPPAGAQEAGGIHLRPSGNPRLPAGTAALAVATPTAPDASAVTWPGPVAAPPALPTILLQTSPVAGFQHHDGEFAWPLLRGGDRLALIREPANPRDAKAVRIEWEGLQLGYLPRLENHAVAQLLDRDEQLHASILALRESSDPWERVQVAVELEA